MMLFAKNISWKELVDRISSFYIIFQQFKFLIKIVRLKPWYFFKGINFLAGNTDSGITFDSVFYSGFICQIGAG